jgi:hypothetical protein
MKNRIVVIIAAIIFLIVLGLLIPYWLLTPVIERKPLLNVNNIPLESSPLQNAEKLMHTSGPLSVAAPLQYASPFPEYIPDALFDMDIADMDTIVVYDVQEFLKSFEQAEVVNIDFSEIMEKINYKNNYHLTIVMPPGNLPPAVYSPTNPSQQSPR